MKIPFLDLQRQYDMLKPSIDSVVAEVLAEQRFVGGERLEQFEYAFAAAHGVKHCIGVGNATDALFIILKALGIGTGDEVIVPAHGWLSAAEMVMLTGAIPVFAEVDPTSYCIDPGDVETKITTKTRAIIPIHLYGQMADVSLLKELADKHGLHLIEDAAQAHFASQNGRMAGSTGIAGAFSFYPSKLLGALGDGGCIVTNNDELTHECRAISNHGGKEKNDHGLPGLNSRLDTLQAAVLHLKMQHVDDWITARNHIAGFYSNALAGIEQVQTPTIGLGNSHNFHLYVIRAERRDELKEFLKQAGIHTEVHYPLISPLTRAFDALGHVSGDFPISEQLQQELLSLPIFATLTHPEVEYVVLKIKEFYGA